MSATAETIRRSELAKIHVAKKQLGLDDDTYRDLLEAVTGKRSAGDLSGLQRRKVLEELKRRGFSGAPGRGGKRAPARARARVLAKGEELSKIRALWLSLYHLGQVRDPAEATILSFAKSPRVKVSVDALQWLGGDDADKIIKALRGWCERVGFIQPTAADIEMLNRWRAGTELGPLEGHGHAAKMFLITAQWRALQQAGAFKLDASLERYVQKHWGVAAVHFLSPEQCDQAIERLGRWVRRARDMQSKEVDHE